MKKFLFIYIWSFLLIMNIYSQGGRSIAVKYKHSTRIPFNTIDIILKYESDSYKIFVITKQMEAMTGHEYSNTENVIMISNEYFDNIYEKLLNLNFSEILLNSENIIGSDGTIINIIFGSRQNNITLNIWSPDYKENERSTKLLNEIIMEIFNKSGLKEWL